jgi:hypothetical protein
LSADDMASPRRIIGALRRATRHGSGSPGIAGIGIVTVLVPKVIVMLVPVVVGAVVVAGEPEGAVVGAAVVVGVVVGVVLGVVLGVVVVVGVVDDGVVVVVVAGVCEVLGTGVNGFVVEPEPPNVVNTRYTASTSSTRTRAPIKTKAHGERYHGRGGFAGGPGGCCS